MEFLINLAIRSFEQVVMSLVHNWPYLLVSVVIATLLKLYVDANKVSAFLARYRGVGVVAATAAAVATPLCSCGTTAVVLGMMASTMPWAPVIAFMVASPLTSPEGLVYSAGLFGWPFALAFYLSSILLGLGSGWAAGVLEKRGWLANQNRFVSPAQAACGCSSSQAATRVFSQEIPAVGLRAEEPACGCTQKTAACGCSPAESTPAAVLTAVPTACGCSGSPARTETFQDPSQRTLLRARPAAQAVESQNPEPAVPATQPARVTLPIFLNELLDGSKRLLGMFLGFAFLGYFLNGLIPSSWVTALFGGGNVYSVPLAATLGLPFYINSESSLPLVRAMLESGMSQGAALAFLIAGSGTSVGAITGALTIARWRVVGLVVASLWVGAILSGFAFDWALTLGWF